MKVDFICIKIIHHHLANDEIPAHTAKYKLSFVEKSKMATTNICYFSKIYVQGT